MLFQIHAGYGSVFKIYRFQNLPAKNVTFSCEREAYPSNPFTVVKMCRHRVNAVSDCSVFLLDFPLAIWSSLYTLSLLSANKMKSQTSPTK